MVIGTSNTKRGLTEAEVRKILVEGLAHLDVTGKHVLVVIPDGTRTAPIPLFYRLLHEIVGEQAAGLDFLVALGTHPPMDDAGFSSLLGIKVRKGTTGRSRIFNHRWDLPETFVTLGTVPGAEIAAATDGLLKLDVAVRLNRLVCGPRGRSPYDQLIVVGPVFPHEVAGFSGGNKYFVPGVAGAEIIDVTHWLGALLTSREIIGVPDTPMRQLIDRAASFIPTSRIGISLVLHGTALHGVFVGDVQAAWRAATSLSADLDIVWVERPFRRVLSVVPEMYDDLWTAAKGMYKLEPAIADGGEVIIYAPHIDEISYVHGRNIDEIGYHVRDYFTAQWEKFQQYPWSVLAHSTHLRGAGTYDDGVECSRIDVTLATGIPRERCDRIGLGYLDPTSLDPEEWAGREHEGVLLVRRAGEILYRLNAAGEPT